MDRTDIIYNLAQVLNCEALKDEPMNKHTSCKIGGNADTYVKVDSLSTLGTIIRECVDSDIDYLILGNGSNVLVSDEGYRGVIIRLDGEFRKISLIDETTVYCGAGASLATLCKFALNNGLSGLEVAWGIAGTVGGGAFIPRRVVRVRAVSHGAGICAGHPWDARRRPFHERRRL